MKMFAALLLNLVFAGTIFAAQQSAEQQVAAAIKAPNISVVHLWAPWCGNCKSELKSGGWTKIVKDHPEVKFYFVSVWDSGDDGRATLAKFDLSQQPNLSVLADPGPRGAGHLSQFLGLPVSWIPTTWIFKGGDLQYAMNYGEMHFPVLEQFLADSKASW